MKFFHLWMTGLMVLVLCLLGCNENSRTSTDVSISQTPEILTMENSSTLTPKPDSNIEATYEPPTDQHLEEEEPSCIFDSYTEFSHMDNFQESIYFVLGDNNLYRVDIETALLEGNNYQPEEITFREGYQFFYITAVSATGELIVWDLSGQIYSIRPDEEPQLLTGELYPNAFGISTSPDGQWVGISYEPRASVISTFTNPVNPMSSIIDRQTGSQINLQDEGKGYSLPVWSPSGNEVAFAYYDNDGSQIQVMDVASQVVKQITDAGQCYNNITWSLDGHALLANMYTTKQEMNQLFLIQLDNGTPNKIFENDLSLGSLENILGYSPTSELLMFGFRGFDYDTFSICIISMAEEAIVSCPFVTVNVWDVPFWMPGEDSVGILTFELKGARDYGYFEPPLETLRFDQLITVELLDPEE